LFDQRVILKKEYLDKNRNSVNKFQTGQEWYALEAIRAVNQAMGRVIRHKNDYGAIFLCDRRFTQQKSKLSSWISPLLKSHSTCFTSIVIQLEDFFKRINIENEPEHFIKDKKRRIK
jgi:regulator of telomere elongation helicase 1